MGEAPFLSTKKLALAQHIAKPNSHQTVEVTNLETI